MCVCVCVCTFTIRLEAQVEDIVRTSYQPPSLKKKDRRRRKRPSQEEEVFDSSSLPPTSPLRTTQSSRPAGRPPQSPVLGESEWRCGLFSSLLPILVATCYSHNVLCLLLLSLPPLPFRYFSAASPLHCHSSQSPTHISTRGRGCQSGPPPLGASLAAQTWSHVTVTACSLHASSLS